eukprot:67772-Chlamydomonas_euryale.AAC.4
MAGCSHFPSPGSHFPRWRSSRIRSPPTGPRAGAPRAFMRHPRGPACNHVTGVETTHPWTSVT